MLATSVWPQDPVPIYRTQREFAEAADPAVCPNSNFLKGVKWSPDGACCLTAGDDKWLRVFDLPQDALDRPPEADAGDTGDDDGAGDANGGSSSSSSGGGGPAAAAAQHRRRPRRRAAGPPDSLCSALRVHAGEGVYDYAWFPGMTTADPASCCFASTVQGHPLHMWDACSGALRCSYSAHDDADNPTAAYSLAFSPDGGKLLGGYSKCFRAFDVSRPGRDCRTVRTQRRGGEGSLPGIVSCLAFNPPCCDLLAAGSYSGGAALFDARTDEQLLLMRGHSGGVTQVSFSRDGNYLYSGARRDGDVICWDIRAGGGPLYRLPRAAGATNQRIAFDLDPSGRHLATGGCDGRVRVFDLRDGSEVGSFLAAPDTVSGCAFHPVMGLPLLATASGHRRYPLEPPDSDSDDDSDGGGGAGAGRRKRPRHGGRGGGGGFELGRDANALRLWRLRVEWVECPAEGDAAMEAGEAESDDGIPLVHL
ncbi:hypothetical protein Rsub_01580 [Raphidocelis subcapitata]|uniref:Uncharacterized protein n=1 Tax=Raphidocelis subcapitata TaxID=307507 RepID=A0A2V0NMF6_9CHLO|nr:hypothetical protein Rsub_01580 [Raphidocelis subcapitata]|eukprot:GBF88681.1 hypothetical protein Rsub_01580 [Raphidocelis subcapitata]